MPPASAPSTRVLTEEEKAALLAQQQLAAAPPPQYASEPVGGNDAITGYADPYSGQSVGQQQGYGVQQATEPYYPASPSTTSYERATPPPAPAPSTTSAAAAYGGVNQGSGVPYEQPTSLDRSAMQNERRVYGFQQEQNAPPPFQPLQPERIGDQGAITLPAPNSDFGNPLEAFVQGADARGDPYAGIDPNPPGPPPSDPLNNPDDAARLQGIRQENAMPQPGASMMTPTALFEAMIGAGTEDSATGDPFEMDPRLAMRQAVNTPDPYLAQHPDLAALERTLSFDEGSAGITTEDILNFRPTTGIVPDADGLVRSDAGFMWGPSPWSAGGAVDDAALVASGARTTPRQSYRPKPRAQSADPIPDILLPRRRSIPVGEAPPSVEAPPPTSPPFSGRRTWVAQDPMTGEVIRGPGPKPARGPFPRPPQSAPMPAPPPPTRAVPSNPRDFTPLPPERAQAIRQQANAAASAEAAARIRARQGTPGGDPYANPRAGAATATPARRGISTKAKAAAAVGLIGGGVAVGKQQMDSHLGGEGESPATGTTPTDATATRYPQPNPATQDRNAPRSDMASVSLDAEGRPQVTVGLNPQDVQNLDTTGARRLTEADAETLAAAIPGLNADALKGLVGKLTILPQEWLDTLGAGGAVVTETAGDTVASDPYATSSTSDSSGGGSGWVDYGTSGGGSQRSGGRSSGGGSGGYSEGGYSGGGFDFGSLPEGFGGADGFMSGMRSNPMFAHLFGGGDVERPRRGPRVKGKRLKAGRSKRSSGKSAVPTNEGIRKDVNKRLSGKQKDRA